MEYLRERIRLLIYGFGLRLMSQCAYVSRDFRITTDRLTGHTLWRRDRWATPRFYRRTTNFAVSNLYYWYSQRLDVRYCVPFWTRRDNRHAPRNATVIFWFVCPFVRSFVRSSVRSFVSSFVRALLNSRSLHSRSKRCAMKLSRVAIAITLD